MEEAFLGAIAASPEEDAPRLVFADWLEENGQPDRAELIRLQCRLEPDRNRFDDADINLQHRQVNQLLRYSWPGHVALQRQEYHWFETISDRSWADAPLTLEWRRGFVETVGVHAAFFVRHGRDIRRRYPLLRKLVIFALNGWGKRLAACETLDGIRELELACWYSDADLQSLGGSPHLRTLQRLGIWSGESSLAQAELLSGVPAWPNLRELHLTSAFSRHSGWVERVNEVAGRPIGSVTVFDEELFPFAHDFYDGLCGCEGIYAGKLPDGTQLIVQETTLALLEGQRIDFFKVDPATLAVVVDGIAFDPDGTPRPEPYRVPFPPELWWQKAHPSREEERSLYQARKEFLRRTIGFQPAMIRVRRLESEWLGGVERFCDEVRDAWGVPDASGSDPVSDGDVRAGGNGARAYHWVRDGMFVFHHRDSEDTFTRAGRSTGDAFVPW